MKQRTVEANGSSRRRPPDTRRVNDRRLLATKKEDPKALCIENAETDDSENSRTSAASQAIK